MAARTSRTAASNPMKMARPTMACPMLSSWMAGMADTGATLSTDSPCPAWTATPKASPALGNERTGLQYLGSVVGDHVKTAICTRLMTGTVVHTGAMIATTAAASGCVAPFAWCTDAGTRSFRLDKFTEIMRTAMGRRKVEPGAAYLARVAALHRLALEASPKGA